MIQAVLFLTGVLAGISFILGLLIALAVVIWGRDVDSAMQLVQNGYYVLVGLLPIALWFGIFASHDEAEYKGGYSSALRAVLTTLQGAFVGSVLGAGPILMAVVVYLPVILADFEISELGPAVRDAIVWSQLWLAVAAAVISAIPLGLWAFYVGAGRKDD
jgi:hypothetical protein